MTSRPRFLRHRYLNSVPSLSEGIGELRHELPLTKILKTLVKLYYYRPAEEEINEHSRISHFTHRILGGGGGGGSGESNSGGADISVFAIVVLTLGLILITEGVLHTLDHFASERKFFRKTLNTCYRELAILGIVEWMVHLYSVYGTMDYGLLTAFTDVHYLLFYTAILNAIQSYILYLGCRRQTLIWWVKTEELALNHYIELRGEFDRLKQKLDMRRDPNSEGPTTIQTFWINFRKTLAHPVLVRKYHRLLVQVRFHELRINIIRANKLPLKFRVSDYLKKCEQEVLMQFIKIGIFTWIALMAATSLVYFALCMALYSSDGKELSPNVAKFLFYGVCILFIVLSCVILQKVKWIFFQIMHTTLIDCGLKDAEPQVCSEGEGSNKTKDVCQSTIFSKQSEVVDSSRTVMSHQLDLFWGKNPAIIIGIIQLVQFGYAMLLSFVIVYWNVIKAEHWGGPTVMMLVCLGCFAVFFGIMTRIVPRFILCTNIGQLMNTVKLRELLAKHRLEECIKKKRKSNAAERANSPQYLSSNKGNVDEDIKQSDIQRGLISEESKRFIRLASLVTAPTENLPVQLQRYKGIAQIFEEQNLHGISSSHSSVIDGSQVNCVTQQCDEKLLDSSPEVVATVSLSDVDNKSRTRSSFGDVSSIHLRKDDNTAHVGNLKKPTQELIDDELVRSKRVRSKSRRCASEGVAAMRLATSIEREGINEEDHFGKLAMSTKYLPKIRSLSDQSNVGEDAAHVSACALEEANEGSIELNDKLNRKSRRKKSSSEGVEFMRALSTRENPEKQRQKFIDVEPVRSKRVRSKGRRCASEGVAAMRLATSIEMEGIDEEEHFGKLAELVTMSTKDLPKIRSLSDLSNIEEDATHEAACALEEATESSKELNKRLPRKSRLKKSFSEGVAFMRTLSTRENPVSVDSGVVPQERVGQLTLQASEAKLNADNESRLRQSSLKATKAISGDLVEEYSANHEEQETIGTLVQSDNENGRQIHSSKVTFSLQDYRSEKNKLAVSTVPLIDDTLSRDAEVVNEERGGLMSNRRTHDSLAEKTVDSTANLLVLQHLRSHFLSKSCNTVNVFGTLLCFFLVGMRMNSLLIDSHEIDRTMVFTPSAENLYWVELSVLLLIVIEGLLRLCLFLPHKASAGELAICAAGAFGGFLGLLGMSLLLVSEALRPSTYGSFGSRSGAGIGLVEPFTSLIFLRFFSVSFGNMISFWSKSSCIQKYMHRNTCRGDSMEMNSHDEGKGEKLSASLHDDISRHYAFSAMGKKTGTIVELWQVAVGLFPDVVEQYGEFSGEMLQVMLGVPIVGSGKCISQPPEKQSRVSAETGNYCSPVGNHISKNIGDSLSENIQSQMERTAHESNCEFTPEKQLGQTSASPIESALNSYELYKAMDMPLDSAANFDYEPKWSNEQQVDDAENMFMLVEPDAPLTHQMRRCERRLLPLLSSWMLVDVIMTEFELVYLDALDCDLEGKNPAIQQRRDAVKRALIATEGGSALLLRDVIIGRKIVGHVDLRCVDLVKVQRHLSIASAKPVSANGDSKKLIPEEYWKRQSELETNCDAAADPDLIREINKKRWERVEEDQLQIYTRQGTLQMRFLCDLKEQEANLTSLSLIHPQKSEALVWGQALVQARTSSIAQPFGEVDEREEKTTCEIEIVARDGEPSAPVMKWRKIKNLNRSLALSKGHQRRASSHLTCVTAIEPNKQFPQRTDVTCDIGTAILPAKKTQNQHRRTSTEPILRGYADIIGPAAHLNNQHVDPPTSQLVDMD